jgi:hypothetical protein
MQLVLSFWFVLPAFQLESAWVHWFDISAPLAIGGLNLGWFFQQLARHGLVPLNDPNRARAIELHRLDKEDLEREEALIHG